MAQEAQHNSAPDAEPLVAFEGENRCNDSQVISSQEEIQSSPSTQLETTIAVDINKEGKVNRTKKRRLKEIKGETQTSEAALMPHKRLLLMITSQNKSRIADRAQVEAKELS